MRIKNCFVDLSQNMWLLDFKIKMRGSFFLSVFLSFIHLCSTFSGIQPAAISCLLSHANSSFYPNAYFHKANIFLHIAFFICLFSIQGLVIFCNPHDRHCCGSVSVKGRTRRRGSDSFYYPACSHNYINTTRYLHSIPWYQQNADFGVAKPTPHLCKRRCLQLLMNVFHT